MLDRTTESRGAYDAFEFTGRWQDFAPIALLNLLLTVVTLGVYRFWATARERRWLWARAKFIDAPFEYTGTGLELFLGFLVVLLIAGPPLFALQIMTQGAAATGDIAQLGLWFIPLYLALLYLGNVGVFRAQRYRLSRSLWRGIRGGSDEGGWKYGLEALGWSIVTSLSFFLAFPYVQSRLWNRRWRAMSFGPHRFRSTLDSGDLYPRFIAALFGVPIAGLVLVVIFGAGAWAAGVFSDPDAMRDPQTAVILGGGALALIYLLYPLGLILYQAKFDRESISALSIGELDFAFDARSRDYVKLYLGDILLTVVTLGVGLMFIGYRHWSFTLRHLGATGTVDTGALTQSNTVSSRQGEGLADAFDFGAV